MKPITKWQIFLHYWSLSFDAGWTRGRGGVDLQLRTPLFAFRLCLNGYDPVVHALVSGLDISVFPASWKFDVKEGVIMYRHYLRLMKCSSLY